MKLQGKKEIIEWLLNQPITMSSRGYGKINSDGTIEDYQLLSYDLVSCPSFKGAVMSTTKKTIWQKK